MAVLQYDKSRIFPEVAVSELRCAEIVNKNQEEYGTVCMRHRGSQPFLLNGIRNFL